jgi:hypothetical protein
MTLDCAAGTPNHQGIPDDVGEGGEDSQEVKISCEGSLAKDHLNIKESEVCLAGKGYALVD